jgi:hypothetical protein
MCRGIDSERQPGDDGEAGIDEIPGDLTGTCNVIACRPGKAVATPQRSRR